MRCLALKTPDSPNNHSAPDGVFDCRTFRRSVAVGSDSETRLEKNGEQHLKRCTPTVGVWS